MYKIRIRNFEKKNLIDELIQVFLRPSEYEITDGADDAASGDEILTFNEDGNLDRDGIKREVYEKLSRITGLKPEWGILTGIRPVKLCSELFDRTGNLDEVKRIFREVYLLSEDKTEDVTKMYLYQQKFAGKAPDKSACVYIGIPFCPTRCLYCSFASNQVADSEIARYLTALLKEVRFVGRRMKETGMYAESLYIGGGTPTTLSAEQLEILMDEVRNSFDLSGLREYTVEAGRPDTITDEKLQAIRSGGADRISINPQSMKKRTLELIGRSHSPEDIVRAFETAKSFGFKSINADIIAGLPEEDVSDFTDTLTQVMNLGADNITVHCLAVKRASRLIEEDPDFHYRQGETVGRMLAGSRRILTEAGYRPYYLYRQKHMAGAGENTGWCRPGTEGIYNMRIMDEHQSNIALGAGGISKIYYPAENRLERVANVTNYEQYIDRIDEMIKRKEDNIFTEVEKW